MSDPARQQRDLARRLEQSQVAERGWKNYGTAIPSGYPTNVPFFRTDLGFWIYSDGVQQLTAHEYVLDGDTNTTPTDATGAYEWQLRQDYAPYITRVSATSIVATTNNATNFWTLRFRGINLARTTVTTIHDFTTAADSVANYSLKDAVPTSSQTPANKNTIQLLVLKTLTPGALTIVSASVAYRLIIP